MQRRSLLPGLLAGSPLSAMGRDPFLQLRREMDRLFDDALHGIAAPEASAGGAVTAPRMDVSESDTEIRICAELPGVSQDDVDLNLTNDVLTISGQKRVERDEQKESFHVVERSVGSFARSIRLPFAVDPSQVQATFENGVLTIALPKPQEQHRSGRIQIKASGEKMASKSLEAGSPDQSLGQAAEAFRSANAPDQDASREQPESAGKRRTKEPTEKT